MLAWKQRTRQRAVDHLGGRCVVCGSTEGLEFDHVDPATKVLAISVAIGRCWSWVRLLVELDKCQLLCTGCHLNKTRGERSVDHGGGASGKRNCPCGPCKARKREYMKQYKARMAQSGSALVS